MEEITQYDERQQEIWDRSRIDEDTLQVLHSFFYQVDHVPFFFIMTAFDGVVVAVVFLLLFVLFAWEVIKAVLESFYPGQKRVRVVAVTGFAAATGVAGAYAVAMTVVRTQATEVFVPDVLSSVLAGPFWRYL